MKSNALSKILICIFLVFMLSCCFSFKTEVYATETLNTSSIKETIELLYDNTTKNRSAGSVGEKNMATKLESFLDTYNFGYFGGQTTYAQVFDIGKGKQSQNIIGEKNIGSKHYVIIGAHYDCVYVEGNSYGYNDNLSGIVGIMELAKRLNNIPYNLVVAFWGAEEVGCLGSKYFVENLPSEIKSNILLYINFDTIGAGDYNYYYTTDFACKYSTKISKLLVNETIKNSSGKLFSSHSVNGSNYYTLGMQSDNSSFLKAGINSLNFFSGNLETSNGLGYFETASQPRIMHNTDSKETIETVFNSNHFAENIEKTIAFTELVVGGITPESFSPNQVTPNLYSPLTLKLSGIIFVLLLFVGFVIVYKIHYKDITIKKLLKK